MPSPWSTTRRSLLAGDHVKLLGDHPWAGSTGTLVRFETYGLGWLGWLVKLENGHSCYADPVKLSKI